MRLPYFDHLIAAFAAGDEELESAFGTHVHWGYWPDPASAEATRENFAAATEALTALVVEEAAPRSGMAVLDAGCGFGGTIAHLNRRLHGSRLVGLNLDGRQLERARAQVRPAAGNTIDFVVGDACRLPFPDASFDAVLAVECIFHFPSRRSFLAEAARVLRPGGRLALSDFLLPETRSPADALLRRLAAPLVRLLYGPVRLCRGSDYIPLARAAGLRPLPPRDLTAETLPTYAVLEALTRREGLAAGVVARINRGIARAQRRRRLLYGLLAFERVAAPAAGSGSG
jgi:SAM-dependent methyltransferase